MTRSDETLARAGEVLDRTRERYRSVSDRARKRREGEVLRRLGRIAAADAAIIIVATIIGFVVPLGMGGALLVMALLVAATLLLAIYPATAAPVPEKLAQVPIAQLPLSTERWLETQRPALPAPAVQLVDQIGVRLETLAPQLATLDDREPAAAEIRTLVGEQLPELIRGYQRVPDPLRDATRNGQTANAQLIEGLRLIDSEIGEMTSKLAQGDLDNLATRGRFLQIKYRDDELGG